MRPGESPEDVWLSDDDDLTNGGIPVSDARKIVCDIWPELADTLDGD